MKEKGRWFFLGSELFTLSFCPLAGPFFKREGGVKIKR